MLYEQLSRHPDLREAGWHSRGYLPHFDGGEIPQFITFRLFDSVPDAVLKRWLRELDVEKSKTDRITLQKGIDKYLDQGYGGAFLKDRRIAERFEAETLSAIMQSLKSLTSHKANKILRAEAISGCQTVSTVTFATPNTL